MNSPTKDKTTAMSSKTYHHQEPPSSSSSSLPQVLRATKSSPTALSSSSSDHNDTTMTNKKNTFLAATSRAPLTIVQRQRHDVLLGRGNVRWHGNQQFQAVVKTFLPRYQAAQSRAEKSRVVLEIIAAVKAWGGRFLHPCGNNTNHSDSTTNTTLDDSLSSPLRRKSSHSSSYMDEAHWTVANSFQIRKKIGQAIRYQMSDSVKNEEPASASTAVGLAKTDTTYESAHASTSVAAASSSSPTTLNHSAGTPSTSLVSLSSSLLTSPTTVGARRSEPPQDSTSYSDSDPNNYDNGNNQNRNPQSSTLTVGAGSSTTGTMPRSALLTVDAAQQSPQQTMQDSPEEQQAAEDEEDDTTSRDSSESLDISVLLDLMDMEQADFGHPQQQEQQLGVGLGRRRHSESEALGRCPTTLTQTRSFPRFHGPAQIEQQQTPPAPPPLLTNQEILTALGYDYHTLMALHHNTNSSNTIRNHDSPTPKTVTHPSLLAATVPPTTPFNAPQQAQPQTTSSDPAPIFVSNPSIPSLLVNHNDHSHKDLDLSTSSVHPHSMIQWHPTTGALTTRPATDAVADEQSREEDDSSTGSLDVSLAALLHVEDEEAEAHNHKHAAVLLRHEAVSSPNRAVVQQGDEPLQPQEGLLHQSQPPVLLSDAEILSSLGYSMTPTTNTTRTTTTTTTTQHPVVLVAPDSPSAGHPTTFSSPSAPMDFAD